jgi:hypothetical protein
MRCDSLWLETTICRIFRMPERKILEPHLEADAVYAAYCGERQTVRRSHLQVIWLLLPGSTVGEVSAVMGLCDRWILKLIGRWDAQGVEGLGDRRRGNAGAQPRLDAAGLAALASALEAAPEDGGLWSRRKVAAWMSAYLGREVSPCGAGKPRITRALPSVGRLTSTVTASPPWWSARRLRLSQHCD